MAPRAWRVLVRFAALVIPITAAAQPRDAPAAEQLFVEGKRAVAAGDLATACARFAESQRLDPAPGTLLNLADCEERRGRVATAWQRFREAIDRLPRDDARREGARARAAALEARLPRIVVRIAARASRGTASSSGRRASASPSRSTPARSRWR